MKQTILTIEKNEPVTAAVYRMALRGENLEEQRPGQFLNIRLAGRFLRRPISVCDWEENRVTILYKVVGGGVGVPPLYLLAKRLRAEGREVTAVLGFNTREEVFGEEAFRALGCRVTVATADGSYGVRGFVTDALPEAYSYFYTCGPEPMLKAVWRAAKTSGQFSFEERMGCGFGACMGCSCKTITGSKRICREGPVLEKEEILWAD